MAAPTVQAERGTSSNVKLTSALLPGKWILRWWTAARVASRSLARNLLTLVIRIALLANDFHDAILWHRLVFGKTQRKHAIFLGDRLKPKIIEHLAGRLIAWSFAVVHEEIGFHLRIIAAQNVGHESMFHTLRLHATAEH